MYLINQSNQTDAIPQGRQKRLESLLAHDLIVEQSHGLDMQEPLLRVVDLAVRLCGISDVAPPQDIVCDNQAPRAEEAVLAAGLGLGQDGGQVV